MNVSGCENGDVGVLLFFYVCWLLCVGCCRFVKECFFCVLIVWFLIG